MKPLNQLRLAAGIPIDGKIEITEHLKVPRHRGELAPKTEKNMRARVNSVKKAIEFLEQARLALIDVPGVNYDEDIPDLVKHLHQMIHGEDGAGGLKSLHNSFDSDLEKTAFADEMDGLAHPAQEEEEERAKIEREAKAKKEGKTEKKEPKKTDESVVTESLESHHDHLVDMMSEWDGKNQGHQRNKEHMAAFEAGKGRFLKGHTAGDEQEKIAGLNDMEQAFMTARADEHVTESMFDNTETFPVSYKTSTAPAGLVVSDQDDAVATDLVTKTEFPNQLLTNPYNDSQKVHVPNTIREQLESEIKEARKEAQNFTLRKDWDNKNFYENMANAFEVILEKLDKKTVYGLKEAQIFMTTLMSPIMNKLPADVIKFIARGGTQRSLKDYMIDVSKEYPVTGKPFKQESEK